MQRYAVFAHVPIFMCFWTSIVAATPKADSRSAAAIAAASANTTSRRVAPMDSVLVSTTDPEHASVATTTPTPPVPDQSGLPKNRFISFSNPEIGWTAIRVRFVSLHHVNPPYTGGPSVPFTLFEGQSQYVGPPTRYVESLSSGTPFEASTLQCAPYYHDWSTVDLLHVTGEAIVPSSTYGVEILAASCLDNEEQCADISGAVLMETSRWGDIVDETGASDSGALPDFIDISELVNKFRDAPDAPEKPLAMLVGDAEKGLIDPRPEVGFSHVSGVVDSFRGLPYPHKPGKCSNNSTMGCISDGDCSAAAGQPQALCVLCGTVSGGACCHGDGTCDILPASACTGADDTYKGDGEPCSRCCGPSPGCEPLTNPEWLDAQQLWPGLDRRDVCKEAAEDSAYNCISWTIDITDEWIWDEVDMDQNGLWEYSDIEAFFALYQKSAVIYGSNSHAVLHTARPLPNNCASSKAGEWIRLRHDRNQIEGGYYGDILGTHAY